MRIDRIAIPDSLRGASVRAQTFEAEADAILNPIDSEEVVDLDLPNATEISHRKHIKGLRGNTPGVE